MPEPVSLFGKLLLNKKAKPGDKTAKPSDKTATPAATATPLSPAEKKVKDAADKVIAAKPDDLKKMSVKDKAKLVEELVSNGEPTGEGRTALKKVYGAMTLDSKFVKAQEGKIKEIAKDLKGDKELKAAKKDWKKRTPDDKVKALRKVVVAQSKALGIPPPEIVTFDEPPKDGMIENGHFDPSDGKLHLNVNAASSFNDFKEALDLVAHENAHNYQETLTKDFDAGKIDPKDDRYAQAEMFAANSKAGAYIAPVDQSELKDYRKQPLEAHSWLVGPSTSKAILKGL